MRDFLRCEISCKVFTNQNLARPCGTRVLLTARDSFIHSSRVSFRFYNGIRWMFPFFFCIACLLLALTFDIFYPSFLHRLRPASFIRIEVQSAATPLFDFRACLPINSPFEDLFIISNCFFLTGRRLETQRKRVRRSS